MSDNERSAADYKRDHELGLVEEYEAELAELSRPQVSRFLHSDFLRVGLPILTGLLDDTFEPLRWEEYVGNQYVGLEIIDDVTGTLLYELPPLIRQGVTAHNADPNRESLTAESQHLFNIRDFNPTEASAQILRLAEEAVTRQNGSLEYGLDGERLNTLNTINAIFEDNNIETLPMPADLEGVKLPAAPEVKPEAAKEKVCYDFDEGEEL